MIGVGNDLRGDDAAGLRVARALADEAEVRELEGEPVGLMDAWDGFERAILVDATQSGAAPGTVLRIAAHEAPLPPEMRRASTHLLGVADAVELARTLEKLPPWTVVYGIEGACFDTGAALSPEVESAVGEVAAAIREELAGA
ncbi:MAG TPA: hydrogenase maturation protease [Gaiellaceae bacterium]|nr:hydrogenase maturation protease [Gaiellaceae bacterium]